MMIVMVMIMMMIMKQPPTNYYIFKHLRSSHWMATEECCQLIMSKNKEQVFASTTGLRVTGARRYKVIRAEKWQPNKDSPSSLTQNVTSPDNVVGMNKFPRPWRSHHCPLPFRSVASFMKPTGWSSTITQLYMIQLSFMYMICWSYISSYYSTTFIWPNLFLSTCKTWTNLAVKCNTLTVFPPSLYSDCNLYL